jgi:hypothetical protein
MTTESLQGMTVQEAAEGGGQVSPASPYCWGSGMALTCGYRPPQLPHGCQAAPGMHLHLLLGPSAGMCHAQHAHQQPVGMCSEGVLLALASRWLQCTCYHLIGCSMCSNAMVGKAMMVVATDLLL